MDDPDNTLHQFNTDACCALRKVEPLERALAGFDGWITGRKRYQGTTREAVEFFEAEGDLRIKVNPLAHWGREDLEDYIVNNRLPRHPLVAKGYPSIGCAPCTSAVKPGEDPRAGRWRGHGKNRMRHSFHRRQGRPHPKGERSMSVIVTDDGFSIENPIPALCRLAHLLPFHEGAIDLANTQDPQVLAPYLADLRLIRVDFPSFADGRGFTLGRSACG